MGARPGAATDVSQRARCSICAPSTVARRCGTRWLRRSTDAVDRDFLRLLANDCLASLPPLTFFQDAVVDESGERTTVFRLEHSALLPLVDVGRVFGMAAGKVLGTSTRERFATARALLPEHESIFREASETLSVVLWQQARIGISQGTGGSELPPALLSRHDRQVLEERVPIDPAAARVHGGLEMARNTVTEPAFVDRYRQRFETTWTDDTSIDRVRFVVLDSETTGLNPRTDRLVTIGAVGVHGGEILLEDSFEALLESRAQHRGRDRARHHPRREPAAGWRSRRRWSAFSSISGTA